MCDSRPLRPIFTHTSPTVSDHRGARRERPAKTMCPLPNPDPEGHCRKDERKTMRKLAMGARALLWRGGVGAGPARAASPDGQPAAADKLDRTLRRRADRTAGTSRVIVI